MVNDSFTLFFPTKMSYYILMSKKRTQKVHFDEGLYQKLGVNQLILFGIYSVIAKKETCTFERLMKECFTFFPKTFSFSSYPQWPDARKLDRPLRDVRRKKLVKGDPNTSFSLTNSGKKVAREVARILTQKKLW